MQEQYPTIDGKETIMSQTDRIEMALDEMNMTLADLAKKLQPIVLITPSADNLAAGDKPRQSASDVRERLIKVYERIMDFNDKIRFVRNSVEL